DPALGARAAHPARPRGVREPAPERMDGGVRSPRHVGHRARPRRNRAEEATASANEPSQRKHRSMTRAVMSWLRGGFSPRPRAWSDSWMTTASTLDGFVAKASRNQRLQT